jgi:LuxR family maltose regulon positive regulatory protein
VRPRPLAERTPDVLSSREREVLVLLAEGRTNREIATSLSVTVATVKSHLVRIYSKLEAANRNEALGRAVSLGLLA